MYSVRIRESVMIAHSLKDPFFGPAQNLHGATFVVDVEFFAADLDEHNVVLNIDTARTVTRNVLDKISYKNLDEVPEFSGILTTAEFVARYVHDQIKSDLRDDFSENIKVTIRETHDAWVSYSGQ